MMWLATALLFLMCLSARAGTTSLFLSSTCDDATARCLAGGAATRLAGQVWLTTPSDLSARCIVAFGDGASATLTLNPAGASSTVLSAPFEHRYMFGGEYPVQACCGGACIDTVVVASGTSAWAYLRRQEPGTATVLVASSGGGGVGSGTATLASAGLANTTVRHIVARAGQALSLSIPIPGPAAGNTANTSIGSTLAVVDSPLPLLSSAVDCGDNSMAGSSSVSGTAACTAQVRVWLGGHLAGASGVPVCVQTAPAPASASSVLLAQGGGHGGGGFHALPGYTETCFLVTVERGAATTGTADEATATGQLSRRETDLCGAGAVPFATNALCDALMSPGFNFNFNFNTSGGECVGAVETWAASSGTGAADDSVAAAAPSARPPFLVSGGFLTPTAARALPTAGQARHLQSGVAYLSPSLGSGSGTVSSTHPLPPTAVGAGVWAVKAQVSMASVWQAGGTASPSNSSSAATPFSAHAELRLLQLAVGHGLPGHLPIVESTAWPAPVTSTPTTTAAAGTGQPARIAALLTRKAGGAYVTLRLVACTTDTGLEPSTSPSLCPVAPETPSAGVNLRLPCLLQLQDGQQGPCTVELTSEAAAGPTSSQLLSLVSVRVDGVMVLNTTLPRLDRASPVYATLSADVAGCSSASPCPINVSSNHTANATGLVVQSMALTANRASMERSWLEWLHIAPGVASFALHARTTCGGLLEDAEEAQDSLAWLTPLGSAVLEPAPCEQVMTGVGALSISPLDPSAVCGRVYYSRDNSTAVIVQQRAWLWHGSRPELVPTLPLPHTSAQDLAASVGSGGWLTAGSNGSLALPLSPSGAQQVQAGSAATLALPWAAAALGAGMDSSVAIRAIPVAPVPAIAPLCGSISLGWVATAAAPASANNTGALSPLPAPQPLLLSSWDGAITTVAGNYSVSLDVAGLLTPVGTLEVLPGPVDAAASLATWCTSTALGCAGPAPATQPTSACPAGLPCARSVILDAGSNATLLLFPLDRYGNALPRHTLQAAVQAGLVSFRISNVSAYGSTSSVTVAAPPAVVQASLPAAAGPAVFAVSATLSFTAASAQVSVLFNGSEVGLSPLWLLAKPGIPSAAQSRLDVDSCLVHGTVRAGRPGTAVLQLRDRFGVAVTHVPTLDRLIFNGRIAVVLTPPPACASRAGLYGSSVRLSSSYEGVVLVKYTALCPGLYGLNPTIDGAAVPLAFTSSTCSLVGRQCGRGDGSEGPVCVQPGAPVATQSQLEGVVGTNLTAGGPAAAAARVRLFDAFGNPVPFDLLKSPRWPAAANASGEDVVVSVLAAWADTVVLLDDSTTDGWASINISSTTAGLLPVTVTLLSTGSGSMQAQPLGATVYMRVQPGPLDVSRTLLSGTAVGGLGAGEEGVLDITLRDAYGNTVDCSSMPAAATTGGVVQAHLVTNGTVTPVPASAITCDPATGVLRVRIEKLSVTGSGHVNVSLCPPAQGTGSGNVGQPRCMHLTDVAVGGSGHGYMAVGMTSTALLDASYAAGGVQPLTVQDRQTGVGLAVRTSVKSSVTRGASTGVSSTAVSLGSAGAQALLYGCECGAELCSTVCGPYDSGTSQQVLVRLARPHYQSEALLRAVDVQRSGEWQFALQSTGGAAVPVAVGTAATPLALPPGLPTGTVLEAQCRSGTRLSSPISSSSAITLPPPLPSNLSSLADHCYTYLSVPAVRPDALCAMGVGAAVPACSNSSSNSEVAAFPIGPTGGYSVTRAAVTASDFMLHSADETVAGSRLYLANLLLGTIHAGDSFAILLQLVRADDGSTVPTLSPSMQMQADVMCGAVRAVRFTAADLAPASGIRGMLQLNVPANVVTVAGECTLSASFDGRLVYNSTILVRVLPQVPTTVEVVERSDLLRVPIAGYSVSIIFKATDRYGNLVSSWHEWPMTVTGWSGGNSSRCTLVLCGYDCMAYATGIATCFLPLPGQANITITAPQTGTATTISFPVTSTLPRVYTSRLFNITRARDGWTIPLLNASEVGSWAGDNTADVCMHASAGVPSPTCITRDSAHVDVVVGETINLTVGVAPFIDQPQVGRYNPASFAGDGMPPEVTFNDAPGANLTCTMCLQPLHNGGAGGEPQCAPCILKDRRYLVANITPSLASAGRLFVPFIYITAKEPYASAAVNGTAPMYAWLMAKTWNGAYLRYTQGGPPVVVLVHPGHVSAVWMTLPEVQVTPATPAVSLPFAYRAAAGTQASSALLLPWPGATAGYLRPVWWLLSHDPTNKAIRSGSVAALASPTTAGARPSLTITPSALPWDIATHTYFTARVVTEVRPPYSRWPTNSSTQVGSVQGATRTCTAEATCFTSPLVTLYYTQPDDIETASPSPVLRDVSSLAWSREELVNVTGRGGDGAPDRLQVYKPAVVPARFTGDLHGARVTGPPAPISSLETAPVYSVALYPLVPGRSTTWPLEQVSTFLCYDGTYPDSTSAAAAAGVTSKDRQCLQWSQDTAAGMFVPGDVDAWAWAGAVSGPFAVSLAEPSFSLPYAPMGWSLAMASASYLNATYWARPEVSGQLSQYSFTGADNTDASVVGMWRAPRGSTVTLSCGPSDASGVGSLVGVTTVTGLTYVRRRQLAASFTNNTSTSSSFRFRVLQNFKDGTGVPFVNYARESDSVWAYGKTNHAAYGAASEAATRSVTPYWRACDGSYRTGNVSYLRGTADTTSWPVWSFDTRFDRAAYNGRDCAWQPLAVHATLGLLDTRAQDDAVSGRALWRFDGDADTVRVMTWYHPPESASPVTSLPVLSYPVLPAHEAGLMQVRASGATMVGLDLRSVAAMSGANLSSTGVPLHALRFYWLDREGKLPAGANNASGYASPCVSWPMDLAEMELGVDYAGYEGAAGSARDPARKPLELTVRLRRLDGSGAAIDLPYYNRVALVSNATMRAAVAADTMYLSDPVDIAQRAAAVSMPYVNAFKCGEVEHLFSWRLDGETPGLAAAAAAALAGLTPGVYGLEVTQAGSHVTGSPFRVVVDDSGLPAAWNDSPAANTWSCGPLQASRPTSCILTLAAGAPLLNSSYLSFQLMDVEYSVRPDWITAQPTVLSITSTTSGGAGASTASINITFIPRTSGYAVFSLFVLSTRLAYSPVYTVQSARLSPALSVIDAPVTAYEPTAPPYSVVHPRLSTRAGWPNSLSVLMQDVNGEGPATPAAVPDGSVSAVSVTWAYDGPLLPGGDDDAWVNVSAAYAGCTHNVSLAPAYSGWRQTLNYTCYRAGWWLLTVTGTEVAADGTTILAGPAVLTGAPLRIQVLPSLHAFASEPGEPRPASTMYLAGPTELTFGTCADWYLRMRDGYGNGYVEDLPWNVLWRFKPSLRPFWTLPGQATPTILAARYSLLAYNSEYDRGLPMAQGSNAASVWRGYAGGGHVRIRACAFDPQLQPNATVTLTVEMRMRFHTQTYDSAAPAPAWITPYGNTAPKAMRVRIVSALPSAANSVVVSPVVPASTPAGSCYTSLPAGMDLSHPSAGDAFRITINLADTFGRTVTDLQRLSIFNASTGKPWLRAHVLHVNSGTTADMSRTWLEPSTVVFDLPPAFTTGPGAAAAAASGGAIQVQVFMGSVQVPGAPGRADGFTLCVLTQPANISAVTTVVASSPTVVSKPDQNVTLALHLRDSTNRTLSAVSPAAAAAISGTVQYALRWSDTPQLFTLAAAAALPLVVTANSTTGLLLLSAPAPSIRGFYTAMYTVTLGPSSGSPAVMLVNVSVTVDGGRTPTTARTCFVSFQPCGAADGCMPQDTSVTSTCTAVSPALMTPRLQRWDVRTGMEFRLRDSGDSIFYSAEVLADVYALPDYSMVSNIGSPAFKSTYAGGPRGQPTPPASNRMFSCGVKADGRVTCVLDIPEPISGSWNINVGGWPIRTVNAAFAVVWDDMLNVAMAADTSNAATVSEHRAPVRGVNLPGSYEPVLPGVQVMTAGAYRKVDISDSASKLASTAATGGVTAGLCATTRACTFPFYPSTAPVVVATFTPLYGALAGSSGGGNRTITVATRPGSYQCASVVGNVVIRPDLPGMLSLNVSQWRKGVGNWTWFTLPAVPFVGAGARVAAWGAGMTTCTVGSNCSFAVSVLAPAPDVEPMEVLNWGPSAVLCVEASGGGPSNITLCTASLLALPLGQAVVLANASSPTLALSVALLSPTELWVNYSLTGPASGFLLPGSAAQGRPAFRLRVFVAGLPQGDPVTPTADLTLSTAWATVPVLAGPAALAQSTLLVINSSATAIVGPGMVNATWVAVPITSSVGTGSTSNVLTSTWSEGFPAVGQRVLSVTLRDAAGAPVLIRREEDVVNATVAAAFPVFVASADSSASGSSSTAAAGTTGTVHSWYMGGGTFWLVLPPLGNLWPPASPVDLNVTLTLGRPGPAQQRLLLRTVVLPSPDALILDDAVQPASLLAGPEGTEPCRAAHPCTVSFTCNASAVDAIGSDPAATLKAALAVPHGTSTVLSGAPLAYAVAAPVVTAAVDRTTGACGVNITLIPNATGLHVLSVFAQGPKAAPDVIISVRPENQPAVGGPFIWPASVAVAAASVTALVEGEQTGVRLVSKDAVGNPTSLPVNTVVAVRGPGGCGSTVTFNTTSSTGGMVMATPCPVQVALTSNNGSNIVGLGLAEGAVVGYPPSPAGLIAGLGSPPATLLPVSSRLPFPSFVHMARDDWARDVDGVMAGQGGLPMNPALDLQGMDALVRAVSLLQAEPGVYRPEGVMAGQGSVYSCPVLPLPTAAAPACVPTLLVLPLTALRTAADGVSSTVAELAALAVPAAVQLNASATYAVAVQGCANSGSANSTLLVTLASAATGGLGTRHTLFPVLLRAGMAASQATRAWYLLPATLVVGGGHVCMADTAGATAARTAVGCFDVVGTAAVSNTSMAAITSTLSTSGSASSAFGVPTLCSDGLAAAGATAACAASADVRTACPLWAPQRCMDGSCRASVAACPTLPSSAAGSAAAALPACPVDAPVLCGPAGAAGSTTCVADALTCALLQATARTSPGTVPGSSPCPPGKALCPMHGGVGGTTQGTCVNPQQYPSACPAPVSCGEALPGTGLATRTRCADGYCYPTAPLQLLAAAAGLAPADVSALAGNAAAGVAVGAAETCPRLADFSYAAPATAPVQCPTGKPVRCEDGTCQAAVGACLAGAVGQHAAAVRAVLAEVATAAASGPLTPARLVAYVQALQAAHSSLAQIEACPPPPTAAVSARGSSNNSTRLGYVRTRDGRCSIGLDLGTMTSDACIANGTYLCEGGFTCAATLAACPTLPSCPPSAPWSCMALGQCTASRQECTALALGEEPPVPQDDNLNMPTISTFLDTDVGIAALFFLILFMTGAVAALGWAMHREGKGHGQGKGQGKGGHGGSGGKDSGGGPAWARSALEGDGGMDDIEGKGSRRSRAPDSPVSLAAARAVSKLGSGITRAPSFRQVRQYRHVLAAFPGQGQHGALPLGEQTAGSTSAEEEAGSKRQLPAIAEAWDDAAGEGEGEGGGDVVTHNPLRALNGTRQSQPASQATGEEGQEEEDETRSETSQDEEGQGGANGAEEEQVTTVDEDEEWRD